MEEFTKQFGIDWRLLLSQAVNFTIVLFVLQKFVYKPVARMLAERKQRIEEGIAKASEADLRLLDAQVVLKQKRREAEEHALALMHKAEGEAKIREAFMLEAARKKEADLMKEAHRAADAEKEKSRQEAYAAAAHLVKEAIIKTVELEPDNVNEALIKQALGRMEK